MRITRIAAVAAALTVVLPGVASGQEHRLAETWSNPGFEPREFRKLLVIGIAGLSEERKRFEDKFVSHLRGRGIEGQTSYSVVPHLDRVDDRQALLTTLGLEGIDGAITVRLAPLAGRSEDSWARGWRTDTREETRVRDLVERSLPVSDSKAKWYGVEVALWEPTGWTMVWAARTGLYKRKKLDEAAAPFVQLTMDALRDARLLP